MNQKILLQLPQQAKDWMIWASIKMMMADRIIREEEMELVRFFINMLGGQEEQIFQYIEEAKEKSALMPGAHLRTEQAASMLLELVKVCGIDRDVDSMELRFLRHASSLLGFKPEILDPVMKFYEIYSRLEQQEACFLESATQYYSH